MALIKCNECKKEVSDTVKNCPNCGYDIKKQKINENTKNMQEQYKSLREEAMKQRQLNLEKMSKNKKSFGYCNKCNTTYLLGTCLRCKLFRIVDKFLGYGLAIITVLAILFLIAKGCSSIGNDEPTQEELEQQMIRDECKSRTNTYYKCDWSVWEGMCVCEER